MEKKLALAYVRVSTNKQSSTGHSLDSQAALLTKLAEADGYQVEVIIEVSSGRKTTRPQLTDALIRLNTGKAAALYALDIDRLARSVKHLCDITDAAKRRGWRLVVSSANIDTSTPQGELFLNMLASMAQFESRIIGQRVERQHEARRARGVIWGVNEGFSGNLAPEVRAAIYELSLEGKSLRGIANECVARGYRTPNGGEWWPATIKAILESPQTKQLGI